MTTAYRANDTSVTFDGTLIPRVTAVRPNETAVKIDTTVMGDAQNTYEAGTTDFNISIEIMGTSDISVGDKGTLAIAYNGGSLSFANAQCFEASKDLQNNQVIKTTHTFAPAKA